ncbi:MAG TPA: transglycosylase SLT domain-containing protein [Gaiellaceae bacterium]|jgi:soluble lytic murein transglycosylase-like protein|nr:transglycosylase SLT domain-containing protein [Gaiellaceae bacterium]
MRPRLIVLLFVAIASGVAAGVVGSATAGHGSRAAFTPPRVVFGMCPIPDEFRPAFVRAAGQSRLPLALLAAVASVESSFLPDERSTAGAHGLLQVLPSTAQALNADTSSPGRNVLAGARYLRLMIDRFKSTEFALAAYNAGPTAVAAAGGAPNRASQAYVHEVTRLWRSFNGCK